MILIGQYDSPFVRRVGLTLTQYGLNFAHKPWSSFGDADKLSGFNPLIRVPTLVLESGESLIETSSILDYLDGLVQPHLRLTPQHEPARRQVFKIVGLATGISDKAVALFYELHLHDQPSPLLNTRLTRQIEGALQALEATAPPDFHRYWFGDTLSQADLAITCMWRHFSDCHPALAVQQNCIRIAQHAAHHEEDPMFTLISQPFIAPT